MRAFFRQSALGDVSLQWSRSKLTLFTRRKKSEKRLLMLTRKFEETQSFVWRSAKESTRWNVIPKKNDKIRQFCRSSGIKLGMPRQNLTVWAAYVGNKSAPCRRPQRLAAYFLPCPNQGIIDPQRHWVVWQRLYQLAAGRRAEPSWSSILARNDKGSVLTLRGQSTVHGASRTWVVCLWQSPRYLGQVSLSLLFSSLEPGKPLLMHSRVVLHIETKKPLRCWKAHLDSRDADTSNLFFEFTGAAAPYEPF